MATARGKLWLISKAIDSVGQNTQKITEAMRLVAAAECRVQQQVIATRPFDRLAQVLYGLQTRLRFEAVDPAAAEKTGTGQSGYW